VASIVGEILIARPITEVFDFVADERNEPKYNPSMVRAEKLTPGAIGKGTRFRATTKSMGRPLDMLLETTDYQRPTRLANTTRMSSAEIHGALTFEPEIGGTRLRWSWDVKPKGAFKLFTPIIGRVGRRQESAIWASLKRYLESTPTVRQADGDTSHR
jgi:Polyketide cyclase / dehydrase and lipid transport